MGPRDKKISGFSLIELMAAMAIGLIVMAAATQLFLSAMRATTLVSQRAEMQQNVRAAINLVSKDISMAGAGLPPNGLILANGAGSSLSRFAVDQTGKSYLANNGYPNGNYMYAIIPGPGNGMQLGGPATIPATNQPADAITTIYRDYDFPLDQYTCTFPAGGGAVTSLNFAPPAAPPPGFPAINDPAVGLKLGDLVLVSNNIGSVVVEVTGIAPGAGGGGTVTFAAGDALNMNQPGAAQGNLDFIKTGVPTTAYRLLVVTYFVEVPGNGQTPRLLRQVNGTNPQIVADNIIGFQVTYDLCDTVNTGPTCANQATAIGVNISPNMIHKVNIWVMGQSLVNNGKNAQNMQLVTSVSTRNITFRDRYN
jgi:prepilin-type N-terminal cleavage/methylation domain-containing protein